MSELRPVAHIDPRDLCQLRNQGGTKLWATVWNDGRDPVRPDAGRIPLYAIPEGCAVVGRELLERIAEHIDYDACGAPSESTARDLAEELRALLGKEEGAQ